MRPNSSVIDTDLSEVRRSTSTCISMAISDWTAPSCSSRAKRARSSAPALRRKRRNKYTLYTAGPTCCTSSWRNRSSSSTSPVNDRSNRKIRPHHSCPKENETTIKFWNSCCLASRSRAAGGKFKTFAPVRSSPTKEKAPCLLLFGQVSQQKPHHQKIHGTHEEPLWLEVSGRNSQHWQIVLQKQAASPGEKSQVKREALYPQKDNRGRGRSHGLPQSPTIGSSGQ